MHKLTLRLEYGHWIIRYHSNIVVEYEYFSDAKRKVWHILKCHTCQNDIRQGLPIYP